MAEHPACGGAGAGGAACDEARAVDEGGARVGDFDVGAVGDGFEEAEEGDFVRGEAGGGGGGGADGGDVQGAPR